MRFRTSGASASACFPERNSGEAPIKIVPDLIDNAVSSSRLFRGAQCPHSHAPPNRRSSLALRFDPRRRGGNPLRVLLVEDDPADAELVRIALCERGDWPQPHWVPSLRAAQAALSEEEIDLLLLDLSLPDGEGLATLKALMPQLEAGGIPCVVMTGTNDEATGIRAIELGAQDLIVKGEPTLGGLRRSLAYALQRGLHAQQLRIAKEEADRLASRCSLTGLANRRTFEDRFEHAIDRVERNGGVLALLYLDLDDFKRINDNLGHNAGDQILRTVAIRLTDRVRRSDTAARLGGDEFAVILEGLNDPELAEVISEQIVELLSEPIQVGEQEVGMRVSVGVAVFPQDGRRAEQLIEIADQRMYAQKRSGVATR